MSAIVIEIAVFDDKPQMMEQLEYYIEEYFSLYGGDYRLHKFRTPSEVFEFMKHSVLHILFMDLEFGEKEEDGILWTKKINETFPGTMVLILTAYEQRYKEGYRARAFRFMTKPLIHQEFRENIEDCMESLRGQHEVEVKQQNRIVRIAVRDILYIEAYMGESAIYTGEGVYYSEQSLLQWEQSMSEEYFFRVHKSYLVHMSHIEELLPNRHELRLDTGERLPVSRRKWTEFRNCFMRYDVSRR